MLLINLMDSGYSIEIEKGVLLVKDIEGNNHRSCVDGNQRLILIEIAKIMNIDIYIYERYKAGIFKGHAGVQLVLENIKTGELLSVYYNADLTRDRTTKHGRKGQKLPKGRFRVGKGSKLYCFWISTGMPVPRRMSAMHDYLGNLKFIALSPEIINRKVANKIIPLINVTFKDIHTAVYSRTRLTDKNKEQALMDKGGGVNTSTVNSSAVDNVRDNNKVTDNSDSLGGKATVIDGQVTDNSRTSDEQVTDNSRTTKLSHAIPTRGLTPHSTTNKAFSIKNDELSEQERVSTQSNEAWIGEWGNS